MNTPQRSDDDAVTVRGRLCNTETFVVPELTSGSPVQAVGSRRGYL